MNKDITFIDDDEKKYDAIYKEIKKAFPKSFGACILAYDDNGGHLDIRIPSSVSLGDVKKLSCQLILSLNLDCCQNMGKGGYEGKSEK